MCSEQGSVTVLTLALGLTICCAGMVSLLVIQLTLAHSTLGSYADLAAIAGVQTGGEPCVAASLVSSATGSNSLLVKLRMGSPLLKCECRHQNYSHGFLISNSSQLQPGLGTKQCEDLDRPSFAEWFIPISTLWRLDATWTAKIAGAR